MTRADGNWLSEIRRLHETLARMICTEASGSALEAETAFAMWKEMTGEVSAGDRAVYLAGNGASASMASHFAADLAKNGGLRAHVFTDVSQVTAVANDSGVEHMFAGPLKWYGRSGDMLVLISSSGNSPNVLAAARAAAELGLFTVTLSGFAPDNRLRRMGALNFYVETQSYGLAENCHTVILHHWMDSVSRHGER